MNETATTGRIVRALTAAAIGLALAFVGGAGAAPRLVQVSSDPLTGGGGQHQTEAEPDVEAFGRTIVAAFQVGRFHTGGGSMATGWATSTDAGATWRHGILPALTTASSPPGPYTREVDNSVAYDAAHGVWMISSLGITSHVRVGLVNDALVVNRSTDGVSWGGPVTVTTALQPDKDWLTCDNWPSSPGYGTCYAAFSQLNAQVRLAVSRSTDGGQTWSQPALIGNAATGYNVQIGVQPSGAVVLIATHAGNLIASRSTDRGQTWSASVVVTSLQFADVTSGIRVEDPKPSMRTDNQGIVYAVWSDCRFRPGCSSNDLVMSTSPDGVSWSGVKRIPLDVSSASADHYLPGLGVDQATGGGTAHLALVYYFTRGACTAACTGIYAGSVTSTNGGATWSAPVQLTNPLASFWIPPVVGGRFLGDYMSSAYVGGKPYTVIPFPFAAHGTPFDQSMFAAALTATPTRITATVGPGVRFSLGPQPQLPGAYVFFVRDRTRSAGFHFKGPGVNKSTKRTFVGTATWRVTLRAGRYVFYSDARGNRRIGTVVIR